MANLLPLPQMAWLMQRNRKRRLAANQPVPPVVPPVQEGNKNEQ